METEQIESAADETKDDKKLPADSEMQRTSELALPMAPDRLSAPLNSMPLDP